MLRSERSWPEGGAAHALGEAADTGDVLAALAAAPHPAESRFYGRYGWCLDAFPTVREVRARLLGELRGVEEVDGRWERGEVLTNVYLLACVLADTTDDYLAGDHYDFTRVASVLPGSRPITSALQRLLDTGRRHRGWRLRRLRAWRQRWGAALDAFLRASLAAPRDEPAALVGALAGLAELVDSELPPALLARRVMVPAAFRTQDLTHHDVLELAARFASGFPDRERAILVVGLRSAGSYFAPLLRASLLTRGYQDVEVVTVRPKEGLARWERSALAHGAARKALAVVIDEPAGKGSTLSMAIDLLGKASLPRRDVVVLMPVHASGRDWRSSYESLPLADVRLIALGADEWFKHRLLAADAVEQRLRTYFRARGYSDLSVVASPAAEQFNRQLKRLSDEKYHTRLKRVYDVRLRGRDGSVESRYVLAKSVGWGWLGYHAFHAAEALSEFVPPTLGLRDGILYTEWLPQTDPPALPVDRERLLLRAASYVAARVRSLRLPTDPVPELDPRRQKGTELLAGVLSRAYGWKPVAVLTRPRIRHELSRRACPVPTLIDGRMRLQEWVRGPASFLKTDFEHHGMGKTELNVTDPAYDLAEAVLHLELSPAEEETLLRRYREASGDRDVEERIFPYKLLAGIVALRAALDNLDDPRLKDRHADFNRGYIEALDFLAAHTARFCARRCRRPDPPSWRSPLVVLDVDGVVDKHIFGFPSTTAAGIEAISLLHAHGMAIALNSARTLGELREYSRAYGCVGGVAEYGSVVWDAATDRTEVLVTPESREQLERLAKGLRRIPGVFLNDRYQHSLRAYSYERGRTVALPTALVRGLVADLGLDRLRVHQTNLDTTVLADGVDKGSGLLALLALAGANGVETIAIGDSEPDLAMFRVASRSFAPSHMSARAVACQLGCRIASRSYQPGFLGAVRTIVHPRGDHCPRCNACRGPHGDGLFWKTLEAADRHPFRSLLRALADPQALKAFQR
jgi:hydroxymethylpyrimidine pyrophosphatase-like HAD family hydrolase